MAVTEPQLPATAEPVADPVRRRRALHSRLSAGHVVMLVAGLVAALLNFALLRAAGDTAQVAVAARDLAAGETVTQGSFVLADVGGGEQVRAKLLGPADLPDVAGHVLVTALRQGDPVRRSDLRPAASADGLRAMSIPVEPAHAAGGAIRVGDRVDVIEVVDGSPRYVAAGAAVLGVTDTGVRGGLRSLTAYSVTVEVDARTALRLAAAIHGGKIEVVRSTGAPAVPAELIEGVPGGG